MDFKWKIRLFQSMDAPGVVQLFCDVYGEHYPVKSAYRPEALIQLQEQKEVIRVVACNQAEEIVGQVAFYRSSPPNRELYEHGQLMVRNDYRTTDLAYELMEFSLAEVPAQAGIEQIWGEAVCNHLFTQQVVRDHDYIETALEVELMPGDGVRTSALAVFRLLNAPPQTLYLPPVYEDELRYIYEAMDWGHQFQTTPSSLPAGTRTLTRSQLFPEAALARFTVEKIGEDFENCLAHMESESSAVGVKIRQVFLKLTEPAVAAAADLLRQRGYFLGGVLPCWFGEDALLMQKTLEKPNFEPIFVLTKRAKQIKQFVADDCERVHYETIGKMLQAQAKFWADRTAVIYPRRGLKFSYRELDQMADRVAASVMALGLERGEHVAVWAPNVPEYFAVELGTARAGLPLVMLNTNYRSYELEYALKQSEARLLFLADGAARKGEYLEAFSAVISSLSSLKQAVLLGDEPADGFMTWQEFLALGDNESRPEVVERKEKVAGSDVFAFQYTSGTTGAPKGAMVSHSAYLQNILSIAERQGLYSKDVVCVPLPFFHAYGCLTILSALRVGATVTVVEKFQGPELLKVMETSRATAVSGTPTMFVAALYELQKNSYDLSSLRGGNMAGSVCPPELVRSVIEQMGASEFGILYGSTEGLVSLMNAPNADLSQRISTVGNAVPGYEIKVIDSQNGATVPAGIPGELCIRSASIMQGYYKMAEKTAETLDEQGWLHSGDLAVMDEWGYVRITGRIKDLIIRGGENIYPAEIESFLLTHPKILDAQVVGIPCDYYGEDLVGFIRLKQGQSMTALELKQYCRQHIALNKTPANFFFVTEYPLTASGKVQKFKLRELAQEKMARKIIN